MRTPPIFSPSVAVVVVHCVVTGEALEAVWERSGLESMETRSVASIEGKKEIKIFKIMLAPAHIHKNKLHLFTSFHWQTNKTSFAERVFFSLGLN